MTIQFDPTATRMYPMWLLGRLEALSPLRTFPPKH